MLPDRDDTVVRAPLSSAPVHVLDLDDTVAQAAAAPAPDRRPAPVEPPSVEPPVLVEPPEPAARSLRTVVESAAPAEGTQRPVPPALHARLLDGTEIPLDRAVYVGRKPTAPRIHTGPAALLVALPSAGREVSATHLELRLVGTTLVASDMRSTNGTVVRIPGAPPRTLLRGESAVVVPGTRIDLGEGAVIHIGAGARS